MVVKDTQLQEKDAQIQRQTTELRERALQLNRQQRELQILRVGKWMLLYGMVLTLPTFWLIG